MTVKLVTKRQAQMALFPEETAELIVEVNNAILDAARTGNTVTILTESDWKVASRVSKMLQEVGFFVAISHADRNNNVIQLEVSWQ